MLKMLSINFDKLSEEHKSFQSEWTIEKVKTRQRCCNFENVLVNGNDVKKHDKNLGSTIGNFKCDKCKK